MSSIPKRIGNYELVQEIGRGATSEVWLARHAYLEQRQVAIKILMAQDRETIQRFNREARLASRLKHANIVQIYDYGHYQPFYCTLMEYIHGGSLQHLLEKQQRLPPPDALKIFKQIGMALDYAHSLDVVHRDVSPGNILVDQNTARALLTDFGIARDIQKSITVSSAIMGTPGYLSPEHVHSAAAVTHLSDIYGLGVILYVMLSGDLPWDDVPSLPDRNFGPPLPLAKRNVTNVPKGLDRIFKVLLAEDPAKRFASAQDAIEELERIFHRHQATTQVVTSATQADGVQGLAPAVHVQQDIVADILGPDLIREPMTDARKRADDLHQSGAIADLLNKWSQQSFLRRDLLGRLARIHKVESPNIYFYTLHVVYEYRSQPQDYEEPDHSAHEIQLAPEMNHWQVPLPQLQGFQDDPGDHVVLPGSTRVVRCGGCEGKGVIVCKRCKGKGRIQVPRDDKLVDRSAESRQSAANTQTKNMNFANPLLQAQSDTTIIPCPNCNGRGGFTCEHCEGVGRVVQYKMFRWQRSAATWEASDRTAGLDEEWLVSNCEPREVYYEESADDFRPEWTQIPHLEGLVQQAREAIDADTHVVSSAVSIYCIPVSHIIFDLGNAKKQQEDERLYRLTIYGFENIIPPDWRFLDWERVTFICSMAFMLILVIIFGFFAL